jgi:hypothetical protein
MRPDLTAEMAEVMVQDRIAAAERFRRQRDSRRPHSEPDTYRAVTVRLARGRDASELRRLAQRDGRRELRAPVLVAEVEGRMLAARSLADGRAVADPFRPTAHLAELLALRAAHLRANGHAPKRAGIRERLALALGLGHS